MARLSRRTRRVLGLAAGAAALGWAAREYAMRSDGWFVRADPARAGRRGRGHRAAGHQRADETNGPRLLRLEREVADADETGDDLGRQHHHHHHGGDRSRSSAASSSCAGSYPSSDGALRSHDMTLFFGDMMDTCLVTYYVATIGVDAPKYVPTC